MPPEQPLDPEITPKPPRKRQPKPSASSPAEQPPEAKPKRTRTKAKTAEPAARKAALPASTPAGTPPAKPKRASTRKKAVEPAQPSDGPPAQNAAAERSIAQAASASSPLVAPAETALPLLTGGKGGRQTPPSQRHRSSADPTFLRVLDVPILVPVAQGALMYGLLVLVIDTTDASIYNSIFVVCSVVPAIIFGLPAGVAVDALPRRPLLVALNLLRFLFILALVVHPPALAGIFATTLAIWMIHQFYAPAESSTLASIVPQNRLVNAQALSNLALVTAQGVGIIIIAPILLKLSDPRYLFAVCAALFLTAAMLVLQIRVGELRGQMAQMSRLPDGIIATLLRGLRVAMDDRILFRVTAADVMVGIGLSALVVVAPIYLKRILNTASENTVFVFAPAAVGVLIGLKAAPFLGKYFGLRWVAVYGLALFATCIAAFGFLGDIHWLLVDTFDLPVDQAAHTLRIPPLALLVMLFSIPAGFASSIVGVASRTITLERTPLQFRGQVIATQSLVQNLGALVPTMLAGIAADQIGVERVRQSSSPCDHGRYGGGILISPHRITGYQPSPRLIPYHRDRQPHAGEWINRRNRPV